MPQKAFHIILVLFSMFFLFYSCEQTEETLASNDIHKIDFDSIKKRDTLIALTSYSSVSYFIYKGTPMGYQYDLLKELTKHFDLELKIIVCENMDEVFSQLNNGEGDIIAMNLTVTKQRMKNFEFTLPHTLTKQVLIQRKDNENYVESAIELADKTIYVRKNSSYYTRLKNLSEEIGEEIPLEIVPGEYDDEMLIHMVANGDIDYTVTDENIALINQTYYPNIDINVAISLPQKLSWAVQKHSTKLKDSINIWLNSFVKTPKYASIYKKYFQNRKSYRARVNSEFYSIKSGKISKYDDIIKKYSNKYGWDWRLVASLIYEESRFIDTARSWAGAYGLMQLMPQTALDLGIDSVSNAEMNIYAGIKYLKNLDDIWQEKIPDSIERIKFILASYNVGTGHILDARKLAKKYNMDTNIWEENVAYFLQKKSNPRYFNDDVVKYGYCKGYVAYRYVKNILDRYEHYKQVIPDN